MRNAIWGALLIGAALFLAGCPSTQVFHAKIDGVDFYAYKKDFVLTSRNSADAIRIEARRSPTDTPDNPPDEVVDAKIVIEVFRDVPPDFLGVFSNRNGHAEIVFDGETWSSRNTGTFLLEVTQMDRSRQEASGTFSFTGALTTGAGRRVEVTDGSFLFIDVDDDR